MAEYVCELPVEGMASFMSGGELIPVHERIVRCGDCRYYDEIIHACDHPCVTSLRGDCPENWIFSCFDNDFCAWGEPREVDA